MRTSVKAVLFLLPALIISPLHAGKYIPFSLNFLHINDIAYAQEGWKAEFADVCSKTDTAAELSKEELKSLVTRCDKLKPSIEALDETERKVYLKRLQMCRNLFLYVIESKGKEGK